MKEKEKKIESAKNNVKKIAIVNFIVLIIIGIIFVAVLITDNKRRKIYIDNVEIKNVDSIVYKIDGVEYINITNFIGNFNNLYSIRNGKYKETSENPEYFYIESPYEAVQLEVDSVDMVKHIIPDYQDRLFDKKTGRIKLDEKEEKNPTQLVPRELTKLDKGIISKEIFELIHPVKRVDNINYVSVDDAKYVFNLKIQSQNKGLKTNFYSIDYLEQALAKTIAKTNNKMSLIYQNRRAIIDDYLIIESNSKFGVEEVSYSPLALSSAISVQYDEIRYSQAKSEIYYMIEDKIGLKGVETKADIIVPGDYDTIDVYLREEGMYIVERAGKFGLIDNSGNTVVPIEFDKIGYDVSLYPDNNNGKILLDKLIPVMKADLRQGELWGFYSVDGKSIPPQFTGLGYVKPTLISPDDSGRLRIPDKLRERARELGIRELTLEDKESLRKLNLTAEPSDIPNNAINTLTIPEGYEEAGVIVRRFDEFSGEETYGVVAFNFNPPTNVYSYVPNASSIFKRLVGGIEEYVSILGTQEEVFEKVRDIKSETTSRTDDDSFTEEQSQNLNTNYDDTTDPTFDGLID